MGNIKGKKIAKVALIVIAALLALDLIIVSLLFVPPIQNAVVKKVTQTLSEKWKSEFSISSLYLTPTLKLVANDVTFKDHHNNNMIYSKKVKGRLTKLRFSPFTIGLNNMEFDTPEITLRTYKNEKDVNISIWAQVFQSDEETKTFILTSNSVKIHDGYFVLINDNSRVVFNTDNNPDIDYAYLELANINLDADDFYLQNDDIAMKIKDLNLTQYGGFDLKKCAGDFRINASSLTFDNLKILTDNSNLDLDLKFDYDNWHTYAEFIDSVVITSNIRPSVLAMSDVAKFAPAIKGMDEIFNLTSDEVKGTVSDFKIKNIDVTWLDNTKICGDFAIENVIDFMNANFDVNIDSAFVNVPDLKKFTLPEGNTININKTISKIGNASLKGTFNGKIKQFVADLNANTDLGNAVVYFETDTAKGILNFYGNVTSRNFNLAKLTVNSKIMGKSSFDIAIDGNLPSTEISGKSLKKASAHIDGKIKKLQLYGYTVDNIVADGDFQDGLYNANLSVSDSNIQGKAVAQLDISHDEPSLQGSVSLNKFSAGNIASVLPKVDSATASGFDKIVYVMQKNPSAEISFEHFQIALHGDNLDNVNGFLGCDNIKINYNEDSIQNERLRLTAINNEHYHKYILSSNLANASFETSYPLQNVKDSVLNFANRILPSLVKSSNSTVYDSKLADNENGYIKLNVKTYNTRPLVRLFAPDLMIAPNSEVNILLNSNNSKSYVETKLPFFGIRNKFRVHNLILDAVSDDGRSMNIDANIDSLLLTVGSGKLEFDYINLDASEFNDMVNFNLAWYNPFNSKENISKLNGLADISDIDNIILQLSPSKIFIKDYACHFNDSNKIQIMPGKYIVDNLQFTTLNSSLIANGTYDTKDDSRLTVSLKNIDASLINPLLDNMSFGGRLFANLSLLNRDNKRVILGKTIVDELFMNESRFGDVFLVAGMGDDNNVRFSGGLFNADFDLGFETLSSYNMQTFTDEKNKTANITGTFSDGNFDVRAIFDTLHADFLAPFLSSFSDNLTGTASGDLSFHADKDSAYFDGTVKVIDANMGISALGTEYWVRNQEIGFNKNGLFFNDMLVNDKDGNIAHLSGDILHQKFRNMRLNLKVHTDRIMALNAPRTTNSFFYGTAFASGDVYITGDENMLSFVGPNIKTLQGSNIAVQVTSTNSASETELIRFTPLATEEKTEQAAEKSSMAMNFDFTFDVTNDADVQLFLESIGGTLNARADGRFRLTYNDNDDLNLYGNLLLHSGDFKISLYDVVNSKFTLVQGGTINFDGPLENMTVDLRAYKTSKTSLSNIIPSEYLSAGNVNVNAGLHLSGHLMQRIEPAFSFELPNSNSEVQNLFYTAIDTQNTENMTKQFAYFLITNSFMPENMFSTNTTGFSGMSLFSNMVNNMLSNVIDSKVGSFGITYNQATETTSAEYGVKANANILKDRITMSTSIGYYDDRSNSDAYNNIYGNFSVEYNINKSGTWKLKAYTYIGDRSDEYFYEDSYNNYTAGVAMAYKQDFDIKSRKKRAKKIKNAENEQ